jgi:magnesium transporter
MESQITKNGNLIKSQYLGNDGVDHVISIIELLETYHEMTSGLMEFYMTCVSLKLNEVMKVLTIIATIFIPPTFIVGVYGMNFDPDLSSLNMPEIQ